MTLVDRCPRRDFLALALPALSGVPIESIRSRLPKELPPGIGAVIATHLARDPASLNTDWFGTGPMLGLLEWHRRGIREVRPFAESWLRHHLQSGTVAKYSGPRSRVFKAGGIPITTYAGHFGLSFPCFEMATQFGDGRARRVCLDLASIILHQTARNHLGLVGHDDHAEFAIPDTCYFAVRALMSAWKLDPGNGAAFLEHAASQLRAYTDTFLAKETGLAKTILHREGLGKTYWTRASGWLLLAITSVLRHLPQSHPSRQGFLTDLRNLVDGMVRVQDPSGGFHVFLDDPAAPLETTGALMFATAAHEAVRMSWLSPSYLAAAQRAWAFAQGNVSGDGWLLNVYTGWAVPAEKRQILMDRRDTGFPAGFLLCAANEMTLPVGR